MTGERILEILLDSHRAVLQTHGIDPASLPVEEMARNAAGILHAELQAEAPDDDGRDDLEDPRVVGYP